MVGDFYGGGCGCGSAGFESSRALAGAGTYGGFLGGYGGRFGGGGYLGGGIDRFGGLEGGIGRGFGGFEGGIGRGLGCGSEPYGLLAGGFRGGFRGGHGGERIEERERFEGGDERSGSRRCGARRCGGPCDQERLEALIKEEDDLAKAVRIQEQGVEELCAQRTSLEAQTVIYETAIKQGLQKLSQLQSLNLSLNTSLSQLNGVVQGQTQAATALVNQERQMAVAMVNREEEIIALENELPVETIVRQVPRAPVRQVRQVRQALPRAAPLPVRRIARAAAPRTRVCQTGAGMNDDEICQTGGGRNPVAFRAPVEEIVEYVDEPIYEYAPIPRRATATTYLNDVEDEICIDPPLRQGCLNSENLSARLGALLGAAATTVGGRKMVNEQLKQLRGDLGLAQMNLSVQNAQLNATAANVNALWYRDCNGCPEPCAPTKPILCGCNVVAPPTCPGNDFACAGCVPECEKNPCFDDRSQDSCCTRPPLVCDQPRCRAPVCEAPSTCCRPPVREPQRVCPNPPPPPCCREQPIVCSRQPQVCPVPCGCERPPIVCPRRQPVCPAVPCGCEGPIVCPAQPVCQAPQPCVYEPELPQCIRPPTCTLPQVRPTVARRLIPALARRVAPCAAEEIFEDVIEEELPCQPSVYDPVRALPVYQRPTYAGVNNPYSNVGIYAPRTAQPFTRLGRPLAPLRSRFIPRSGLRAPCAPLIPPRCGAPIDPCYEPLPELPGCALPQLPGCALPQLPGCALPQLPGCALPQLPTVCDAPCALDDFVCGARQCSTLCTCSEVCNQQKDCIMNVTGIATTCDPLGTKLPFGTIVYLTPITVSSTTLGPIVQLQCPTANDNMRFIIIRFPLSGLSTGQTATINPPVGQSILGPDGMTDKIPLPAGQEATFNFIANNFAGTGCLVGNYWQVWVK
ncbi:MAG: hypothetical protein Hyperionvirus9_58 [Hyperionvirus sp.]|uniref:Uncharacterized protein n=1 Tax=Hyperionvirus sp. TaxID=2487770 RepID=A0A3G5ABI1_9VIRU|nr:MAG: hypothetical protein Hyperionvirus9_58 [Hyperionvirus sp.]